jgi:hypothetical protein
LVWLVPGRAGGAGGAFTGGVKRLPPVGLMLFSVELTVGDGAVVVVGVVVLEGLWDPLPPQAVNAPIETTAAMPRLAAARRLSRPSFMMQLDQHVQIATVQWSDAAAELRCWPASCVAEVQPAGMAVGAGVAVTDGVKRSCCRKSQERCGLNCRVHTRRLNGQMSPNWEFETPSIAPGRITQSLHAFRANYRSQQCGDGRSDAHVATRW